MNPDLGRFDECAGTVTGTTLDDAPNNVMETGLIRSAHIGDAFRIAAIYNDYVRTTTVTFEEEPVSEDEMAERIQTVGSKFAWFVYEVDGEVAGYCYATPWRARSAYRFSVETTVYVAPGYHRQGIARKLYTALIAALDEAGVRVLLAGIALPNDASVRLHEQLCFEKAAHLKQVGRKFDRWIDVGYWELILHRAT